MLEIPYEGKELAMVFVLPDQADGLEDVERNLTSERLSKWMEALKDERVNVALPRFEVRPGASIELGEALKKLGMARAFDPGEADFTGMANPRSRRSSCTSARCSTRLS